MKKDVAEFMLEMSEIRSLELEAKARYEALIQRVLMKDQAPETGRRPGVMYAHPPSSEKHN